MSNEITPGQIAYDAYAAHTGGKTWNGYPMPTWAELPENVRAAWETAGRTVRRYALEEIEQMLQAEHARMNAEAAS